MNIGEIKRLLDARDQLLAVFDADDPMIFPMINQLHLRIVHAVVFEGGYRGETREMIDHEYEIWLKQEELRKTKAGNGPDAWKAGE